MNYWDTIAENRGYYMNLDHPSRQVLLRLIKDGESLLDIGCGNGATFELLMKERRDIAYTGLDYSERMIQNCNERWPRNTCFILKDVRDLKGWPGDDAITKEWDTVYIRHSLENQCDWKETIRQAFRLARKRVIIDMRRPFVDCPSYIVEQHDDTFVWNINYDEFNLLCRDLTVSVSYYTKPIGDTHVIAVLGKRMDDVVLTLDDFHETNDRLDLLLDLKSRFPGLKVTLFTIPSKSPAEWLLGLKKQYPWMEFAVHGWFHDVNGRIAQESNYWTKEEAHRYLQMAEDMGVFVRGFKAPGWNMNPETFYALQERGYWCMDHKDHSHERPNEFTHNYETGHLWEVNGHIQICNMNGLPELATTKCNFRPDTRFHFVSEMVGTDKNQHRLECLCRDLSHSQGS